MKPDDLLRALRGQRPRTHDEDTTMIQFHETRRGASFYDAHVPRIADALESIASALQRLADAQEQHALTQRDVALTQQAATHARLALIDKLSDTMSVEGARAFVDDVLSRTIPIHTDGTATEDMRRAPSWDAPTNHCPDCGVAGTGGARCARCSKDATS